MATEEVNMTTTAATPTTTTSLDPIIVAHFAALLNTALVDSPTQVENMNAVKEALLFQPMGAGEQPLIMFGPHLCSFSLQTSNNMDIRHFVLRFVEEATKSERASVKGLEKPIEALYLMLDKDTQPALVTRWAARCAATSWKHALWVLAQGAREDCSGLHTALFKVVENSKTLLRHGTDRQTRILLCRFFEVTAQTFLGQAGDSKKGGVGFESLVDLPMSHPTLRSAKALEEDGLAFCSLLASLSTPGLESDPHVRMAASIALTNIAKSRPAAQTMVIDKFATLSTLPELEIADKQQLKSNLMTMLKTITAQDSAKAVASLTSSSSTGASAAAAAAAAATSVLETPAVVRLSTALTLLGAGDSLEHHLLPLKKKRERDEGYAREYQKRLREYPGQTNALETEGLSNLPPESLARLLVHNAVNVPSQPPPRYVSRANLNPDMGPHGIPMCLERVMNLIRAVETGRGLALPAPLANAVPRQTDTNETFRQREAAFLRVVQAVLDAAKPGSRAGGGGWEARTYETCALIAARLACDVDNEVGGTGDLRQLFVDKLVKRDVSPLTAADQDRLLVCASMALTVSFASDLGHETKSSKGYDAMCLLVFEALGVVSDDKLLPKLMAEVPRIPPELLRKMMTMVCDRDHNVIGLGVLRELIMSRPSLRDVCLTCVMCAAIASDVTVREMAVRLLSNRIQTDFVDSSNRIRAFASATLNSVIGFTQPDMWIEAQRMMQDQAAGFVLPDNDVVATTPITEPAMVISQTARRLDLSISLCKTRDETVGELLACYANIKASSDITPAIKLGILQAFQHQTKELWLMLRERLTVLRDRALALFQMFPEGAEDLVLAAVTSFADKDPDSVCTAVKLLRCNTPGARPQYETDARFVIPIIGSLTRDEALVGLTRVAEKLELDDVKRAIGNLASGAVGRTIEASELLLCLTNLNANNNALVFATKALLDHPTLVTASALRVFFDEVSSQQELPTATMRVAIMGLKKFPELKPDILVMLEKLFAREFWNNKAIWNGFCHLVTMLKPESYNLVFQLPETWFLQFVEMEHLKPADREAAKKSTVEMMRNVAERDDVLMGRVAVTTTTAVNGGDVDGEEEDEDELTSGEHTRRKRMLTAKMKQVLRLA